MPRAYYMVALVFCLPGNCISVYNSENNSEGAKPLILGIISKDLWPKLQQHNNCNVESKVFNVLTVKLETLDSYNIFTKAIMLRRKGVDVIAVVVPGVDSVYLLPDFNTPAIFLTTIKNNLVISSDDIVEASATLFPFNKEMRYVLCTTVKLIRKLEWTSSIIIYDNSTEAVLDRFIAALVKQPVMLTTFNIDEVLRHGTVYELLKTLYNELLGTTINITVICQPKCVTSLLQQANKFDLTEENYGRTALYLESRWLIVSLCRTDFINVSWSMLRLLNVALVTSDILIIQHQNISVNMAFQYNAFLDDFQFQGRKGSAAGCLNAALPLSIMKTKAGAGDTSFFFSILNIKPPELQKKIRPFLDEKMIPYPCYVNEPNMTSVLSFQLTLDKDISLSYFQLTNILKTLMVSNEGRTMVSRDLSYEDSHSIQYQVYPNVNYGFNGRKFIVTTIVYYPFVMRNITNGTISYYGYCMDLLEALASSLNFTYEVAETADNQFGALLPNGSWTGIVGLLQRREVDLAVAPLTIEARREMVMDFTNPFYFDSMTFLMRRPDESKDKWRVFINPFHWIVIVCVCSSVPVFAFFTYILEKYKYVDHHDSKTESYGYQYAIMYLFGKLISQGGGRTPTSRSSRILVSTWWIFSVVLASTYCGNLVAFLTVVKEKAPINTFDELVSQTEFKWGTIGGSIYETLFQNSTNPTFQKIWQGIEKTYPTDTDILHKDQDVHIDKVLEEKYAYLFEKTHFEILMRNDCRYTVAEEEYPTIQYGVGLPQKSPLTWIFSKKISQLMEGGFHYQWVNAHWPNTANCKKALRTEAKSITVIEMQGTLYFIGAGLVVSFVILCIECIINYCVKYRSLSEHTPQSTCQLAAASN